MKIKLKINELEKSGLINCLPEDIFLETITSTSNTITIEDHVIAKAKNELTRRKESNRILNEIASLNNKGIQYEKSGMIEKALIEYQKCMKLMYESIQNGIRNDFAWHSPNRLRILYKKEKHPREKVFLEDFARFCSEHQIDYPETFSKQLEKHRTIIKI